MKFILGKKIGMSRILDNEKMVPVTLVLAEKCFVTQIKTIDKDGYNAIQLGTGRKKNINKPEKGHLKQLIKDKKIDSIRKLIEFKTEDVDNYKLGQEIDVSTFTEGDNIVVSGISKGKGFAGVVKRHGFKGAPTTHGHRHDTRAPGSIGAAYPQHVFKGIKMAGRMGNTKTSIKNLTIRQIDSKNNILVIEGSLPGARNNLLTISSI